MDEVKPGPSIAMDPVLFFRSGMSRAFRSQAPRKKRAKQGGVARDNDRTLAEISPEHPETRTVAFSFLLFASGASALVYQLLWIKQLSLIVGIEVYAITTAVSAFFAGLAVGGAIFGRLADRTARPLQLYARLEFAVAVSAVSVTLVLSRTAAPFATLESKISVLAWIPLFFLIAAPAFLMGGTLPVLVRAQMPGSDSVARSGGNLYSANTAGAVFGALLVPFALLPAFGVRGSALTAALLNFAIAGAALFLGRKSGPIENDRAGLGQASIPSGARLALALYAIAGGVALGYEVVWSQSIIQFMSTRSFAFAIVLATFLAGLVLGSAAYSRIADRVLRPWRVFGILIATAGLLALACTAGIGKWFVLLQYFAGQLAYSATSSIMAEMCARFVVVAIIVILPAALFLGAAFPAALRLAVDAGYVGRDVGAVVALNTAGGICGTLITGFVLVPRLGTIRSLAVLAVSAVIVGLIAALKNVQSQELAQSSQFGSSQRSSARPVAAIGMLVIAIGMFTPPQKLIDLIPHMHGSNGAVIFHEDDPGGTVVVTEEPEARSPFHRLYIQGVSNSGDSLPSLRYMRLQTFIPLLIHSGEPHSALVIGLGTGITAGASLRYSGLTVRVCDELLPGVIRATRLFQGNFSVGTDPKIEIRHRDGRRDLLQSVQKYDVITLEPPPPSAAGVVNLYSSDFYKLAASRLAPGGIFAQWLPIATQRDADSRSLVRSFLDVFPYATLWTTELHEMLLVGSFQAIDLDMKSLSDRFSQPRVAEALNDVGVDSLTALLATWVTGRGGLEEYASSAEPVTDDRPRIEYAPWVRPDEITRSLPALLALRTSPPLRNATESQWNEVTEDRDRLHALYAAALAAYNGDRARWSRIVSTFGASDLRNAYYRWFLGADAALHDSPKVVQ
jgi:spermidine synthase